ncbi:MAG: 5-amino-6-(D-ribitylamino)uracil--L-tyrosine 4-hydroxyphenyl transferase CofH [Gammaproteobacteria bacterium]|jgi:FO synthase|nr:5-amino-6-(D-ribitylamino)uracil--L-tyrosine 4-hydroxyphenyl transferase CofH [Gammaproteobacteria bacterium]MBT7369342.1 5-amino-6-(D-ribitylamino)uracil--L-tyrosine 4-hydroxyphenyl transferase CofH [Gammaproteobacteria bacterium]
MTDRIVELLDESKNRSLSDSEVLTFAGYKDTAVLMLAAGELRDTGHQNTVSYSRKVFIPLTHLCRDVCHYCTFAQVPRKVKAPYLAPEEVLKIAEDGARAGCKEALFTLGDKPELRYKAARDGLKDLGQESTLSYLKEMAEMVFDETGLFPHLNPGLMTADEFAELRKVSISMGIMLESASGRLTEKGMPHHGSPDKIPERRFETLKLAGEARVPFTSGILIGIGETRQERLESLLALRSANDPYGHIQEIIIQNFRAKPETLMANAPEPDLNELLWTIAMARVIFGPEMNIQAPPNLSPGVLEQIVDAGINDWGGVSPVTPDFVNPEAPWPHLTNLADETANAGKMLIERLALYPAYANEAAKWTDPAVSPHVLRAVDGSGFARTEEWSAGAVVSPPETDLARVTAIPKSRPMADVAQILERAREGERLGEKEIVRLFKARGDDYTTVCQAADELRRKVAGDEVTYCVNRNINYTNICYFKCQFCAFSKGKMSENLRGKPYDLSHEEIMRRTKEAWERGASEVCLQGGIHPEYTGQTYIDVCRSIKQVIPEMHIHAFSPLEVWQGAKTLGIPISEFLGQLKEAGLGTLPGTAAEILDDEVRATLCADKINTAQWLEVMEEAHAAGFNTTATIMYGHVEQYHHVARHLLKVRDLQEKTGGFTEFVILPFIHMEAPMYLKGLARKGPTFREAILIHAISRLVLYPHFRNIQASWTKLGHDGVRACLQAGVNDLGGTLMNETITRAAGASHGQETSPEEMEEIIRSIGRHPRQRSTTYGEVSELQKQRSFGAVSLVEPVFTAARRYERGSIKKDLVKPGLEGGEQLSSQDIV